MTSPQGSPLVPSGDGISSISQQKAAASKAFLENHYRDMLRGARDGGTSRPVGPREKDLKAEEFEILKCIGRGAFGEVFICRKISDGNPKAVYAMKRMRKADMMKKKQVFHVRSERDVLAEAAAKNPWVVQLMYSFQDDVYLYMVMEYMQGGDLISWLVEKETFHIDATRFYIAELCAAVASVHVMNFVHRDIKPDNILLDANGHVKLSDFGLCKRFAKRDDELLDLETAAVAAEGESGSPARVAATVSPIVSREPFDDGDSVTAHRPGNASPPPPSTNNPPTTSPTQTAPESGVGDKRLLFDSIVGSPGYIAPEILLRKRYGVNCDWWSVGVIMYEMLYGCPPFYSEDPQATCHKIIHWKQYLIFPNRGLPDVSIDFMKRLMCDPKDRMNFDEIKAHPFFEGVDWSRLRTYRAAFIPDLRQNDPLDTKYFPHIDERQKIVDSAHHQAYLKQLDPHNVMFADFSFNSQRKR